MKQFYSPQLASGGSIAKAEKQLEDPRWVAQEKLDGCRYIVHYNSSGVRIYSRKTSEVTGVPVLKTDRLPHIVEEIKGSFLPGTILDGEIITIDPSCPKHGRSSFVTSIMGSSPEVAVEKQKDYKLVFAAFDILYDSNTSMLETPFLQRYQALKKAITERNPSFITYIPIHTDFYATNTKASKLGFLRQIWADQGEGIILKDTTAPYLEGKRNKAWVKIKDQLSFDCIITDFVQGVQTSEKVTGEVSEAKYKDMVGAICFGQYKDGELITIGKASGFSDAIRQDMTHNPQKYLGKVITVTGHQQLDSGAIRHPQTNGIIREDKDAKDCIVLGDMGG